MVVIKWKKIEKIHFTVKVKISVHRYILLKSHSGTVTISLHRYSYNLKSGTVIVAGVYEK